MDERLVGGKKYRILTDAANDIWDRISFWTKASDVVFDDNTTLEQNKPIGMLKRGTIYNVNDVAYPSEPSWAMLVCTTAGQTGATAPSFNVPPGRAVKDGAAYFTVYDVRVTPTLTNNACMIPSMSLVNNLNSQLTANGQKFQFAYDSVNQKYGFNIGGTLIPFSGGGSTSTIEYVGSNVRTYTCTKAGLYCIVGGTNSGTGDYNYSGVSAPTHRKNDVELSSANSVTMTQGFSYKQDSIAGFNYRYGAMTRITFVDCEVNDILTTTATGRVYLICEK